MAISRTRSAGAKLTDDEYRQLQELARAHGLTVGEWCRDLLLAQLGQPATSVPERVILAEVLGLRMIVINLFRALGSGERLTQEVIEAVVRRADGEKLPTAIERLSEAAAARKRNASP
jgi:hypothetical protein